MKELIDVFKMDEIPAKARARVIIKLGRLINNKYQSNISEPIVYELVRLLDPKNDIFDDVRFVQLATK